MIAGGWPTARSRDMTDHEDLTPDQQPRALLLGVHLNFGVLCLLYLFQIRQHEYHLYLRSYYSIDHLP